MPTISTTNTERFEEYRTVHGKILGSNGDNLEDRVQALLDKGWHVFGTPQFDPKSECWFQVMVVPHSCEK